jgi:transposase InsO family protein
MTQTQQRDISRKLRILRHAAQSGNVSATFRYFGISRQIYYRWRRTYEAGGELALVNKKPCPQNIPRRTPAPIEEKILYLRKTYHLGPRRIAWYLERYHDIKISPAGVHAVLTRNGLNRLPRNAPKRTMLWHRYEKQVPGHHVQVDVKFLTFTGEAGERVRRFQYTAIDDATRIRALKVYERHTQANAIRFVDHVVAKFPFRIATIRTDNGHEFQAKFHAHVEDLGIHHAYIKVRTPRLNGKVERSHRTDGEEFYQLLTYKGDVDLEAKLEEWERFYNYHRPHSAHYGKTPYEALREKLKLALEAPLEPSQEAARRRLLEFYEPAPHGRARDAPHSEPAPLTASTTGGIREPGEVARDAAPHQ